MNTYLAVLGKTPALSLAELSALFHDVTLLTPQHFQNSSTPHHLATFTSATPPNIHRLGGSLKIAASLSLPPLEFLQNQPASRLTIALSDYSTTARPQKLQKLLLHWKKSLKSAGKSVRLIFPAQNSTIISTATAHHNQLGEKPGHLEIIAYRNQFFTSLGAQNITAYTARDQARPARDAKNGMLPPKLAQILLNLAGPLPPNSLILDPFCGSGVVLQEALLMQYRASGSDLSPIMVEKTQKNLHWLQNTYLQKRPLPLSPQDLHTTPAQTHTTPTLHYSTLSQKSQDISPQNPKNPQNLNPSTPRKSPDLPKSPQNPPKIPTHPWHLTPADATTHTWHPTPDAVIAETFLGDPLSAPPSNLKLKSLQNHCRTLLLAFLQNLAPQIPSGTPVILAIPAWLRPDGTYSRLNLLDDVEKIRYNVTKYQPLSQSDLIYFRPGQVVAREIISLRKR